MTTEDKFAYQKRNCKRCGAVCWGHMCRVCQHETKYLKRNSIHNQTMKRGERLDRQLEEAFEKVIILFEMKNISGKYSTVNYKGKEYYVDCQVREVKQKKIDKELSKKFVRF